MKNHTIGQGSWDSHERVCNLFRQSDRGDIAFVLFLLTTVVRVSHCNRAREKRRNLPSQGPLWASSGPSAGASRRRLTVEVTYMKCAEMASGDAKSRRCIAARVLLAMFAGGTRAGPQRRFYAADQARRRNSLPTTPRARIRSLSGPHYGALRNYANSIECRGDAHLCR